MTVPRKLAQDADKMFERNLAILAGGGQELEVVTSTDESYIGFAAGLDEEYLQFCCTKDQVLVLVNRDFIVSLRATGRTMTMLPAEVEGGIKAKCSMFQGIASKHSYNQLRRDG